MNIKISATFEGKCSLCGKETIVFSAGNEDTKKVITICKECVDKLGNMSLEDAVEKFGVKDEKIFEKGIKIERK